MPFVDWDEKETRSKGGRPDFHKWTPGRHRLRFVGRAVEWVCPPFADGESPKNRYLAHALVGGELRVVDMPAGMFGAISEYARAGRDVAGPKAPEYIVSATGAGLSRRYIVMAGADPAPVPATLDIQALDAALFELGNKLEARVR